MEKVMFTNGKVKIFVTKGVWFSVPENVYKKMWSKNEQKNSSDKRKGTIR